MSKFSVRILEPSEQSIWDNFIDQADGGTIFHKYAWLKAAEKQSNTKCFPLVCEKDGEGIVSVFPVFLKNKGFLRVLLSPPNGCAIPEMGPVFGLNTNKQNKIESDQYNALLGYKTYIKQTFNPHFEYYLTNLYDVRPYTWLGYSTKPLYTYKLNLLEDTDKIYTSFDPSIRNRIKKTEKRGNISIRKGKPEQLDVLLSSVQNRYSVKGREFKVGDMYLKNLYQSFNNRSMSLNSLYFGTSAVSHYITLRDKDHVRFWLGGVKDTKVPDGINEYIHWHNIQDAKKQGCQYYERIGANTKSLCENKSKYGLSPHVLFKIQYASFLGKVFFSFFNLLRKNKGL